MRAPRRRRLAFARRTCCAVADRIPFCTPASVQASTTLPGPPVQEGSRRIHHAMTTHTSEANASAGAPGLNSPPQDLFAGEAGEKTVAQAHSELPPHQRAMRAIE